MQKSIYEMQYMLVCAGSPTIVLARWRWPFSVYETCDRERIANYMVISWYVCLVTICLKQYLARVVYVAIVVLARVMVMVVVCVVGFERMRVTITCYFYVLPHLSCPL